MTEFKSFAENQEMINKLWQQIIANRKLPGRNKENLEKEIKKNGGKERIIKYKEFFPQETFYLEYFMSADYIEKMIGYITEFVNIQLALTKKLNKSASNKMFNAIFDSDDSARDKLNQSLLDYLQCYRLLLACVNNEIDYQELEDALETLSKQAFGSYLVKRLDGSWCLSPYFSLQTGLISNIPEWGIPYLAGSGKTKKRQQFLLDQIWWHGMHMKKMMMYCPFIDNYTLTHMDDELRMYRGDDDIYDYRVQAERAVKTPLPLYLPVYGINYEKSYVKLTKDILILDEKGMIFTIIQESGLYIPVLNTFFGSLEKRFAPMYLFKGEKWYGYWLKIERCENIFFPTPKYNSIKPAKNDFLYLSGYYHFNLTITPGLDKWLEELKEENADFWKEVLSDEYILIYFYSIFKYEDFELIESFEDLTLLYDSKPIPKTFNRNSKLPL